MTSEGSALPLAKPLKSLDGEGNREIDKKSLFSNNPSQLSHEVAPNVAPNSIFDPTFLKWMVIDYSPG